MLAKIRKTGKGIRKNLGLYVMFAIPFIWYLVLVV